MARRNKEYYNKQTSMHVNDVLHKEATSFAIKNDLNFYSLVDKVIREYLEKKGIVLNKKNT